MRVTFIPHIQGRNEYPDTDGTKYGIAIHNTSNNATDTQEANYAARRTDGVSSHFYVDKDSATQSIDTRYRCGHAGSKTGNENAVCIEITGANGWSRAQWLANVQWDLLGRVLASVIKSHWPDGSFKVRRASVAEMQSNPKVKAFYGHDDMRRAWGGTTHTDPGPNFPWDKLFAVVNAAMGQTTGGDADMGNYCAKGDKNDNVERLQLALNRLIAADGYGLQPLVVDSDYGPATCTAVVTILKGGAAGTPYHPELDLRLDEKLAVLAAKRAGLGKGEKGDKGDDGIQGPPGKTPTKVQIASVVADVIEVQ